MSEKTSPPRKHKRATRLIIWYDAKRHNLIMIFALMAVTIFLLPLPKMLPEMHSMFLLFPQTIGRFQHYGFCLSVFGAGYFLQLVCSRATLGRWGRTSYFLTGLFFLVWGIVFANNPWLDFKVGILTEENERQRLLLVIESVLFALLTTASWVAYMLEEDRRKKSGSSEDAALPQQTGNS